MRESDRPELPESWTAAGNVLAFSRREAATGSDVWILPLGGDGEARPFLESRFEEGEARFSYDGRWIAYQSDESGQPEVYVQRFPGPGGKRQISVGGGTQPRWRRDGGELYYRRGADVMRVAVPARGETVSWPPPEVLFTGNYAYDDAGDQSYDVAPDGRFLMMRLDEVPRADVHVVVNWHQELKRLIP